MSAHARAVTRPDLKMTKPNALSYAAQLRRSYRAGQHSRLQALDRNPPYDDDTLSLAWVCGYDATQREIEEWESE